MTQPPPNGLSILSITCTPERANLSALAIGMGLAGLQAEGAFSWARTGNRTVLTGVLREDLASACARVETAFQAWSTQLTTAKLPELAAFALELAEEATRIRCQALLNETQSHLSMLLQATESPRGRLQDGVFGTGV